MVIAISWISFSHSCVSIRILSISLKNSQVSIKISSTSLWVWWMSIWTSSLSICNSCASIKTSFISLCNSWASIEGRLRCDRNSSINLVAKLYQIYQISNLLNYLLQFSTNYSSTLNIIIWKTWLYKVKFFSKTNCNKNSFLFKEKCYLRDNLPT